jgi:hypothetical protein
VAPTAVLSEMNQPSDGEILILKLVILEVLLFTCGDVMSELPELKTALASEVPTILIPFFNWALVVIPMKRTKVKIAVF